MGGNLWTMPPAESGLPAGSPHFSNLTCGRGSSSKASPAARRARWHGYGLIDMEPGERAWTDLPITVEDLPGTGRRYDVRGKEGGRLSVVIHRRTGEREISVYGPDEDDDAPARVLRLSDTQARNLGSILGGAFFKSVPVEELETVLAQLTIDWLAVPEGSPLAGRSIGQMELRRRTGLTIMAIIRGHQVLAGPTSDDVVEADDRIVVAGRRDGLAELHRLLAADEPD